MRSFISSRLYRWKLSPSTNAARTCSRRKICSNVLLTDVVPAPEEPVTAMTGCLADIAHYLRVSGMGRFEQASSAEQGRIELKVVVIAVIALDHLDLRPRAEHEADPLVDALRHDIEDRTVPGAGATARLLDQEADRVRLVQQPQPSRAREILTVARIHEHAATHQDPVGFGHEGGDPTHVEIACPGPALTGEALVHVTLDRRLPITRIRSVDGELGGLLRDAQVRMGEHELTDLAIEGKAVDPAPGAQHEHGRGSVDGIAGANLRHARLQKVLFGRLADPIRATQHRKDTADRDVHIDVRGAVQGIEQQQILP